MVSATYENDLFIKVRWEVSRAIISMVNNRDMRR